jgi:hypothetical protein
MTVRFLYSANASFPRPLASIEHSDHHSDTRLTRFQEVRPLAARCSGPDPIHRRNMEPDPNRVPLPVRFYSTALHLFMYSGALSVLGHQVQSASTVSKRVLFPLRERHGLDIRGCIHPTYIHSFIRISKL